MTLSSIQVATEEWKTKQDWNEHEAQLTETLLFRLEEEELKGSVLEIEKYSPLEPEHYVHVMNGYSKCVATNAKACQKAEDILDRMAKRGKMDARFKVNRFAINTVVSAYAKSPLADAPLHAERLLTRLEEEYQKTRDDDERPTTQTYAKVIEAWARSDAKESAERAMNVLKRLEHQPG